MNASHAAVRSAIAAGDGLDEAALAHLDGCRACRSFAAAVADVRRLAPAVGRGPLAPAHVADRVIDALHRGGTFRPARRARLARVVAPRLAGAAAVVAVLTMFGGVVVPSSRASDGPDLSDALLVSAQRTEDAGTARLRLRGSSDVTVDGRVVTVAFTGVGELSDERLHYRGLTRVGEAIVPCELTVVGSEAWARRKDGAWMAVREPAGALAPVVLDAGSVLALLRMPKTDVREVDSTTTSRTVSFVVAVSADLAYDVTATFGARDRILRHVSIEAKADDWRTRATMDLYGFGEPVAIHAPARGDVIGIWEGADAGAARAVFPFG